MADFWDVLEDGDIIHKIDPEKLVIGQRVLLTRPNGTAFTATVQSIADDGTVTLAMFPEAPKWTGEMCG